MSNEFEPLIKAIVKEIAGSNIMANEVAKAAIKDKAFLVEVMSHIDPDKLAQQIAYQIVIQANNRSNSNINMVSLYTSIMKEAKRKATDIMVNNITENIEKDVAQA